MIEIAAMTELKAKLELWKRLAHEATARMESWRLVQRLLAHAERLPDASAIEAQLLAIEEQRTLLSDPDPLTPIRQSLANVLREAITSARDELATARADARTELEATDGWSKLEEEEREQILPESDLLEPPPLALGTDEELLGALDRMPLDAWAGKVREIPAALEDAMLAVARRLEPDARRVQLPRATLKTLDEVENYITSAKTQLESEIAGGPIVVS